ncbi:MAG TPA: flagellar hook-associated protein FlgL [Candidatus Competibacteraceae bacterium]|nr:flagellar hook-associated protein FlgL [Candidatus Competibacteraceae bacterium]MCP5132237.1 flagellar hook-associated protein FlgL [Gammaproteobacteria bacterium]HPF59729.1 flagellar hook-associated protein FlgL [Candidatus Competibacteraceae bacterium]HRY17669.1 flagellar hook-associated protein FlgL [Candidatus Competibacteraceae bacterium]
MRISTSMIYRQGVKWMNDHQAGLAKAQAQISSGRKLLKPSDDPTNSARLMDLHKQIKLNEQYGRNIIIANGRQSVEEVAVQESTDILQRARELTIQANNAALTSENRQTIALEVQQLREQLLDTANARDADGAYLFAGFKEQSQPFTKTAGGDAIYNGDQGQRSLQIGPSRQVPVGDTGDSVFMLIRNGNGQFRTSLAADNTGNGTITVGSIANPTEFQNDFMGGNYPYTIEFSVTAAPNDPTPSDLTDPPPPITKYRILDASGTEVVPLTPLAADDSYQGETISFNGIEVAVEGHPDDGDRFIIKPAENQSVFKTLDNLINTLGNPDNTASDVAVLTQGLNNALTDIDQALLNLNQVRGRIGSRMNALDTQEEVNQNLNLQLQNLQSDIGSTDIAEAASRMSQELLALQASQQSFVKIQNLSLFNHLR